MGCGLGGVLASLGFEALATTSSGFAATLGRLDGSVTRDEAIEHGARLAAATDVPISADLEHGFADDPEGVAETIALAVQAGIAGGSIEDYSGSALYAPDLATARVAAAAEAAHGGDVRFVLTARAENHIRGNPDLADTISRLQAYQEAGADVLYAPGLRSLDDIRTVVAAVDRPVNVLALQDAPGVAELAAAGVKRISVGGAFAYVGDRGGRGRGPRAPRTGHVRLLGHGRSRRCGRPRRVHELSGPYPRRKAITSGNTAGSCAKNAWPPS